MALGGLAGTAAEPPVELADRLELFVDHHLIEQFDGTRLSLGRPQPANVAVNFDQPWEKAANYVTVIKAADVYRMYYRGGQLTPEGEFDPA